MPYQKQVVIQQLVLILSIEAGHQYLNLASALEKRVRAAVFTRMAAEKTI